MDEVVTALRTACGGEVRAQASLAELTTLRVGGRARALVTAERDSDLAAVGRLCREHGLPWTVIGRGSNLLVGDDGWPGIALQLGRGFRGIRITDDVVTAGAAEPLPTLAVRVADAGLGGFAWACAVPGTVGGAVRMNAGAHGGEISHPLVEVEVVRLANGTRETWVAEALGLGYRRSELPWDAVVVAASFRFERADGRAVRREIADIRAWRREHQPLNQPNCGSVFTNPPDDSAGRLIEAAGLKGATVGEAQVSPRHANFIVTRPGATAADVETLISTVRDRVHARTGVELRTEVTRLGGLAASTRTGLRTPT